MSMKLKIILGYNECCDWWYRFNCNIMISSGDQHFNDQTHSSYLFYCKGQNQIKKLQQIWPFNLI